MKKSLLIAVAAIAIVLCAVSCTKELTGSVDKLSGEVTELTSKVSTLDKEVATLKNTVSGLSDTLADLTKEPVGKVVVLNNALPLLDTSIQCYNAKEWHKSYSMKELVENNFWYLPAEDTKTSSSMANDAYCDEALYGGNPNTTTAYLYYGFKNRYISFAYLNPAYDYDIFVGRGMSESYQSWYMNYSVVGREAVLYVYDELSLADAIDTINSNTKQTVAVTDSWKCVDVDGKETVLSNADLRDATLVLRDDKFVDLIYGSKEIKNIQSFAPATYTPATDVPETEVARFTVALNAKGVYGVEPQYEENRAGTYYPTAKTRDLPLAGSYSVADLFDWYKVEKCDAVDVVAYADGFTRKEDWDWVTAKYIAYHASNELITIGKAQAKSDDSVWNIGFFATPKAVFTYIPANGTTFAKAYAHLSLNATPVKAVITYTNGLTREVSMDYVQALEFGADCNVLSIDLY